VPWSPVSSVPPLVPDRVFHDGRGRRSGASRPAADAASGTRPEVPSSKSRPPPASSGQPASPWGGWRRPPRSAFVVRKAKMSLADYRSRTFRTERRCGRSAPCSPKMPGIGARLPTYRLMTRKSALRPPGWWRSSRDWLDSIFHQAKRPCPTSRFERPQRPDAGRRSGRQPAVLYAGGQADRDKARIRPAIDDELLALVRATVGLQRVRVSPGCTHCATRFTNTTVFCPSKLSC
jgi:hypothetical protein